MKALRAIIFATSLLYLSACTTTGEQSAAAPECPSCGPSFFEGPGGPISDLPPPPTPPLVLTPFGDGKYWILREKFSWNTKLGYVVIPKGFVTDLTSVPRPFWTLLPKWDGYGSPAIVHDFLYHSQNTSRYDADEWILEGMTAMNVGVTKRHTIYTVLRLFGGFAWAGNTKKKVLGKYSCVAADHLDELTVTSTWADLQKYAVACEKNIDR